MMKELITLTILFTVLVIAMPSAYADNSNFSSDPPPCPLHLTALSYPATCTFANCNGSITVSVTGGVPPYTYSPALDSLCPGTYIVSVTDAVGCTATKRRTVWLDSGFWLTPESSPATTIGGSDGSATVLISAALTPTVLWNTGETTPTISNLSQGKYTVTVIDGNGCESSTSIQVFEGCGAVTTTSTPVTAPGNNDGSASVSTGSGTPPITYFWSNGAVGQHITNLSPGIYCVTVVDAAGCAAIACVNIGDGTLNTRGIEPLESVTLYPNPASDVLFLSTEFKSPVHLEVRLLSLAGQAIRRYYYPEGNAQSTKEVDISDLPAGMYLLELQVGNQRQVEKFIKF